MRIIDELTQQEILDPDLQAGYTYEASWASPDAYATIDNMEKFALEESDYERVLMYHAYTQEEMERNAEQESEEAYLESRHGITDRWLIEQIAKAVTVPAPPASKEGFLTVPRYDVAGNSVVWTFEPDPGYQPTADGSYLHPFTFVAPMAVTAGLWYTDGSDIWECVEAGLAESFTAPWFDVVA